MLRLEIGRRYIRRNGTITPPLEPCGNSFFDPETNFFYSNAEFGNHIYGPSYEEDEDLVSEALPQ